ncbi:MAG: Gfo/Idh/MocA family oxidoreductase [Rhizobiales bacterium]|nr:Gfo/Idh/MocA family oxidoreductase [Hyphomicrobiales bacterium]
MLRAVLVGCGLMSRAWLEAVREVEGLEIVGLADIDVDRAASRAAEFGLADAVVGADAAAVIDATRPDIVFDVVVPDARHDLALLALRRGCHVLTEKPMAASLAEAEAIIAAAAEAGRLHAVVQNRRYHPGIRRIRRFLEAGAIGTLTSVHCDFFIAPHFGGFHEAMDHVLLLDMAIHTFDAARYMIGAAPTAVWCHEWEPAGSWYRQGSSAVAVFGFEDGTVFNYRGSWCAEGLRTSWESSWRFVGTHGSLAWDGADDFRAERVTEAPLPGSPFLRVAEPVAVPALSDGDRVGGHVGVIRDFVAAVRTGVPPETRGDDNIRSLAMVFGAIESAESGRRVQIGGATPGQANAKELERQ